MGLWVRAMGQEIPYGAVGARYGAGGVPMGLWVRAMGQEAPYGYLLWGRRRPMGLWVPAMGLWVRAMGLWVRAMGQEAP